MVGKKIAVAISVLALITAALIFADANNIKNSPPAPKTSSPSIGAGQKPSPARISNTPPAADTQPGTGSPVPSGPNTDSPLDKVDVQSAKNAYGKATSLATRAPEADDITKLIPVLLKFSPSELSTLTRLASRTMTKDEIEQAKSILLSKLNQEDVSQLLQLGPKYSLDFRAVLGATDKSKK